LVDGPSFRRRHGDQDRMSDDTHQSVPP
jgi:hypothetical protein